MLRDGRALTNTQYREVFVQTPADLNPTIIANVGKKRAGRLLDGREWSEFPQGRTDGQTIDRVGV